MNCEQFQSVLDQFISNELSTEQQALCEQHINDCESCLVSWSSRLEAIRIPITEQDQAIENEITSVVMQKLGIDACEQSESMLSEFSEGEMESVQNNHLRLHLNECNECSELLSTLMLIEEELHNMAEVNPASDFASQVLAQTHPPLEEQNQSWFARITGIEFHSLFLQLMKRPRFPIEAAFAATVVWTSFFGVPTAANFRVEAETLPLVDRDRVQQRFAIIQNNVNEGITNMPGVVNEKIQNLTAVGRNVLGSDIQNSGSRGTKIKESLSNWIYTRIFNPSTTAPVDDAGDRL